MQLSLYDNMSTFFNAKFKECVAQLQEPLNGFTEPAEEGAKPEFYFLVTTPPRVDEPSLYPLEVLLQG